MGKGSNHRRWLGGSSLEHCRQPVDALSRTLRNRQGPVQVGGTNALGAPPALEIDRHTQPLRVTSSSSSSMSTAPKPGEHGCSSPMLGLPSCRRGRWLGAGWGSPGEVARAGGTGLKTRRPVEPGDQTSCRLRLPCSPPTQPPTPVPMQGLVPGTSPNHSPGLMQHLARARAERVSRSSQTRPARPRAPPRARLTELTPHEAPPAPGLRGPLRHARLAPCLACRPRPGEGGGHGLRAFVADWPRAAAATWGPGEAGGRQGRPRGALPAAGPSGRSRGRLRSLVRWSIGHPDACGRQAPSGLGS